MDPAETRTGPNRRPGLMVPPHPLDVRENRRPCSPITTSGSSPPRRRHRRHPGRADRGPAPRTVQRPAAPPRHPPLQRHRLRRSRRRRRRRRQPSRSAARDRDPHRRPDPHRPRLPVHRPRQPHTATGRRPPAGTDRARWPASKPRRRSPTAADHRFADPPSAATTGAGPVLARAGRAGGRWSGAAGDRAIFGFDCTVGGSAPAVGDGETAQEAVHALPWCVGQPVGEDDGPANPGLSRAG